MKKIPTKFSKILQIKEKEVELGRLYLQKAIQNLENSQRDLRDLEERSDQVDLPLEGEAMVLKWGQMLKESYRTELIFLRNKIIHHEKEVEGKRLYLHKVELECEKFLHLHDVEIKKVIKLAKEKEGKDLDEIGTQRFFMSKVKL